MDDLLSPVPLKIINLTQGSEKEYREFLPLSPFALTSLAGASTQVSDQDSTKEPSSHALENEESVLKNLVAELDPGVYASLFLSQPLLHVQHMETFVQRSV